MASTEVLVSKGQGPHPHAKRTAGRGSSMVNICGTSYMRAHGMRHSNQISHGGQTR